MILDPNPNKSLNCSYVKSYPNIVLNLDHATPENKLDSLLGFGSKQCSFFTDPDADQAIQKNTVPG